MLDNEDFPDPRPMTHCDDGGVTRIVGWRCADCGFCVALKAPWCPKCHGPLVPTEFGPGGVVWASTVVRVPLPGRTPPYGLIYVDIDAGPRVLGHLRSTTPMRVRVGHHVRLVADSSDGDLEFEVT